MKLAKLHEMTYRSNTDMDGMTFIPLPDGAKYEGEGADGYEVFSYPHNNTVAYGMKVDDEYASVCQVKDATIAGKHYLMTLISTTKKEFRRSGLSLMLKHFIVVHCGKGLILDNLHSRATETMLKNDKFHKSFTVKLINVKTGEIIPFTNEDYEKLTNAPKLGNINSKPTDWQVLLVV